MKRLKELCSSLPRASKIHSPLDNVVTQIFQTTEQPKFIHSQSPPVPRYQARLDHNMLQHHNDHLDGFDECGPNEQYLINKIFYSPCYLVYVIGGIGVGKTTFTRYLMSDLLHKVRHQEGNEKSKCPTPIYFNFLRENTISVQGKTVETIQSEFLELFCTRIEAEIASKQYFADVTEQVEVVWESIIAAYPKTSQPDPASSHIVSRVFDERAKTLPQDVDLRRDVLATRVRIRDEIMRNLNLRVHYLARLLNYIRDKYYQDHRQCFLVIVDNIDREQTLVQRAVGMALKPFANNSQLRIVVNVRPTTYHEGQGDFLSETVDIVPYCGPKPLSVIIGRINDFVQSPEAYEKFYKPSDLPELVKGIAIIRDSFLSSDRFVQFFEALTGNSVRKGLILAQNLILNSIYDPYEIGKEGHPGSVKLTDVLRALMVGSNSAYRYSINDLIENVFEVQQHKSESPLIKLRILRTLSISEHGVTINRLINNLQGFNYSMDVLRDALNDMIDTAKRLAWSDAVPRFDSVQELVNLGASRMFISTVGQGYESLLCKKVEYLQEVMLDTSVSSDFVSHFGKGYDYGKMEDRFTMVSRFCSYLAIRDMDEVSSFITNSSPKAYEKEFGGNELISLEILDAVMHDIGNILNFVIDHLHGETKNSRVEFRENIMGYLNDQRLRLVEFHKKAFSTEAKAHGQ